jgi:membrane protein implicated in regulation of membrane protease activity
MKRRIMAWALLAGFVLLLLNVMFIKFYWQLSMILYLIIVFAFLMYNSKATRDREAEELRRKMEGGNNRKDGNEGNDGSGSSDISGMEDNDMNSTEGKDEAESNDE